MRKAHTVDTIILALIMLGMLVVIVSVQNRVAKIEEQINTLQSSIEQTQQGIDKGNANED